MDKNRIELESLCLKTIHTIDSLRTQLFENEFFHDNEVWEKRLKKLKKQIKDIYWEV